MTITKPAMRRGDAIDVQFAMADLGRRMITGPFGTSDSIKPQLSSFFMTLTRD